MFSQFKKAIVSGLDELERLGDESFQREQRFQQHPGGLGQHGRGYSESVLSSSSIGSNDRDFPSTGFSLGPGRRSPAPIAGGGRGGAAAAGPSNARPLSASAAAPSTAAASQPIGVAAVMQAPSSPLAMNPQSANGQQDTFPSFGLGGIRRSLSHLPRSSLDLGGLRTSFDATSPSGQPVTPSREGRELGDWRPSTSGGSGRPGSRRRISARAASISGPFTPDTMTKMDPFFFASLQGLSDELKIAAFTPLPKEDADEELDQIDQELNPAPKPAFNSLPIVLPQIITSNLTQSVPASFRPSSAPAAGPAHSFGQMAKSPLAEQTRRSLLQQSLHDHEEVDEEDHGEGSSSSMFSHTPETVSVTAFGTSEKQDEADQNVHIAPSVASDVTEASPAPVFDDLPDVSRDGQARQPAAEEAEVRPVPFGRLSASSTPRRGRSPARTERGPSPSISPAPPEPTEPSRNEIAVPDVKVEPVSTTEAAELSQAVPEPGQRLSADLPSAPLSRSVSPTPSSSKTPSGGAKVHEPLAARLARISRASSPLHASIPAEAPTGATAPHSPKLAAAPDPSVAASPASSDIDRAALEAVLRRYTPLKNGFDLAALERYLQSTSQAAPDTTALKRAEEAEKKLQGRVAALEAEVRDARAATTRAEAKTKEEEEKKAKSITLLKAVRQKLLKAEKDKEEAEVLREAAKASEESLTAETKQLRQRYEQETMSLRTSNEQQLARLRASYEREAQSIKATFDREAAARRGQAELEMVNMRSAHSRELGERGSRINTLENQLRDLRREKDELFDTLQGKNADVESATERAERAQVAHDEVAYALREAEDRVSALQEEVGSFKKARLDAARDDGHTRRLLADLEATHSERISSFESRIKQLERERADAEDAMAAKLQEKLRELDRLRRDAERRDAANSEETQRREERQARMDRAESQVRALQEKVAALDMLLGEARRDRVQAKDEEATVKELLEDQTRRNADLEARLEELGGKEAQLRQSNKTLREELRKVQAGILLSERSRNPGVGYFSSLSNGNGSQSSLANTPATERDGPLFSPDAQSANGQEKDGAAPNVPLSSASSTGRTSMSSARAETSEEALNFEYIRNVILQFLEHKEMRPHLVSVLGVILQFTPAETRRLSAKALA